jgi:hypothetical protein
MTSRLNARTACLFLLATSTVLGADLPYIGKWKLNASKSDFTGTMIRYTQVGDELSYEEQGQTYKFKIDGRDYITPFGYTAAWKRVDEHTAQMLARLNGKLIETDTLKLSPDYKVLTVTSAGKSPNGEKWEDESVYKRVGGETGLAGTWKATRVKITSLKQIEFAPFGSDGLTWKIADYNTTCSARFDGKDYPVTGASAPSGMTAAIRQTGPGAFQLTEKKDGKVLYKAAYTVSADRKTLTEVGNVVAVGEKTTAVYDRQ